MKPSSKLILGLALLALVSLALVGTAALAAGDYQILWWTVDGGGGTSYGSETQYLSGSVSRYSAGQESKGDKFALSGGFWGAADSPPVILIYLPYTNHTTTK
jgi:hypothetical protein